MQPFLLGVVAIALLGTMAFIARGGLIEDNSAKGIAMKAGLLIVGLLVLLVPLLTIFRGDKRAQYKKTLRKTISTAKMSDFAGLVV